MRQSKALLSFSATAFRISNHFKWKSNSKHQAHLSWVPFLFFQILDPQILTAVVALQCLNVFYILSSYSLWWEDLFKTTTVAHC